MKYSPGEKHEIIRMVEGSSLSVRKTLNKIGVSKSTFYEWYRRYLEDGVEGLKNRTRCLEQFWNKIPEIECQAIVELALENPELSSREIAVKYTDERG